MLPIGGKSSDKKISPEYLPGRSLVVFLILVLYEDQDEERRSQLSNLSVMKTRLSQIRFTASLFP